MDIHSKKGYPSWALSNFAPHEFIFDGVFCAGMEGFLQSLKCRTQWGQRRVCRKAGKKAKAAGGRRAGWKKTQTLHWKGTAIPRDSEAYRRLLTAAYDALFAQNEAFRRALAATGTEELTHEIGGDDPRETVLTREEFIGELMRLRNMM